AEIDAAGVEGFQRAKLLRDDERRVIRQHDPARPHAHGGSATRHVADHHRSGRTGDPLDIVMLGQPEPMVAPALRMLSEVVTIRKCLRRGASLKDGREVEDGVESHGSRMYRVCGQRMSGSPRYRPTSTSLLTSYISVECSKMPP